VMSINYHASRVPASGDISNDRQLTWCLEAHQPPKPPSMCTILKNEGPIDGEDETNSKSGLNLKLEAILYLF
jgi:hypothetical protein